MLKYPIKISDEELIKTYLETKSLRKTAIIAQGTDKSFCTIGKRLKKLGVEVKDYTLKPIIVSDEKLIELYNSGMSLMKISKLVSGSNGAMKIRDKLQKLGIDTSYKSNIEKYKESMSKACHKYTLDENVFDVIDTEEKAYWLGFLFADGYNHESKNTINLRLQYSDYDTAYKFSKFLHSNAPIYKISYSNYKTNYIKKDYAEVRINSVHLSKQLSKLGCFQGKTYTIEFPNYIQDDLMNHFIRGYFDGDGCISITNRKNRMVCQFTLTGRKEFLIKAQQEIVKRANVNLTKIEEHEGRFAVSVHYCGYDNVFKIMSFLYENATIYMERKHDKYLNMVIRRSNSQKCKIS